MTSYLPSTITAPLSRGNDLIRSTIGGFSWGPALSVSKAAVKSLFGRIEIGSLVVVDNATGQTLTYGEKADQSGGGGLQAKLVVKKDAFWVRLFLFADMGFAESFMLGEVECEDLTGFFEVSKKKNNNSYQSILSNVERGKGKEKE